MNKQKQTMVVRLLGSGCQMDVPKGLYGDKLQQYVQTKLKEEEAEAALVEAKSQDAAEQCQRL